MFDSSFGWRFVNPNMKEKFGTHAMGETAECLADEGSISREDQDAFACWSQEKAARARESGRLALEIEPVLVPMKKGESVSFAQDEFIKPGTTMEGLSRLKPAFRAGGTVTAGNASAGSAPPDPPFSCRWYRYSGKRIRIERWRGSIDASL
jgi:acetyl-CoA acetyltransferase